MHLFAAVKMGHLHLTNNTEKVFLISLTHPEICLRFNHGLLDCLGLDVVDPYEVRTFTRENIIKIYEHLTEVGALFFVENI